MNRKAIAILGAIFLLIVGTLGFLIFKKTTGTKTPAPVVANVDNTALPENQENLNQDNANEANVNNANSNDTNANNANNANTNTAPGFGTGKGAVKLTDDQVVSPALFFQGNGISYFNHQGQLFKTDLNISGNSAALANKKEITIPLKIGLTRVLWPSTGNNFISEINKGGKKSWSIYNSDSGQFVDLPSQVTSVDWFPTGDKIIYLWFDGTKTTMNGLAVGDNKFVKISDINQNDDEIHVSPAGSNILFFETQNQTATNPIILLNLIDLKFKAAVKDGYNFGVLWSPDNSKFLFAKRDPLTQKFQLWLGDIDTGQQKSLGVNSIVDKALWDKDGQNIYVGVPKTGDPTAGLTEDTLYKINVSTFAQQSFDLGLSADMRDLFLNLTSDKIFFKNLQDEGLYYMNLKP